VSGLSRADGRHAGEQTRDEMNAQPFQGDDGSDMIVDEADDGTTLPGGKGWICDACGILYAKQAAAEGCCMEP
jgi:hypothetical protein